MLVLPQGPACRPDRNARSLRRLCSTPTLAPRLSTLKQKLTIPLSRLCRTRGRTHSEAATLDRLAALALLGSGRTVDCASDAAEKTWADYYAQIAHMADLGLCLKLETCHQWRAPLASLLRGEGAVDSHSAIDDKTLRPRAAASNPGTPPEFEPGSGSSSSGRTAREPNGCSQQFTSRGRGTFIILTP